MSTIFAEHMLLSFRKYVHRYIRVIRTQSEEIALIVTCFCVPMGTSAFVTQTSQLVVVGTKSTRFICTQENKKCKLNVPK